MFKSATFSSPTINLILALCLPACFSLGVACGGKAVLQADDTESGESLSAVDLLEQDIKLAESTTQFPDWFVVRYNPPACDCPALEMLVKNRWLRIHVDWEISSDNTSTSEALAAASNAFAAGQFPLLWLHAKPHARAYLCAESTLCARAVGYALSLTEPTDIAPNDTPPEVTQ
ncbi:MAG: hypothetical protein HUU55_17110 [Myxococcales bacterium]|nr:hypothetical protein [Myxococcales bacterium]